MDGRRGRDGKVKQVEGLILLLMFYESYVESYVLTLTALEVQPWPESLHCVDILCVIPYSASSHWGWDRQNVLGVVPYIPRILYRFLHRFTYAQRNNTKYKFNADKNFRIRFR